MSRSITVVTEQVLPANLQKETPETEAQLVGSTTSKKDVEQEKEMLTLREALTTQEALWERERVQK